MTQLYASERLMVFLPHSGFVQLRFSTTCRTAAEAVKAALSPHPSAAARFFQLPPSGSQLAAAAPHLLQGRTLRRRNQPALRGDQLCRSRLADLCLLQ